ncbi:MAG: hypothetical protein U9O65_04980 [Thermotogota bacterium]|nr:hypothetical protein [Thermotogota bacterium]
MKKRARIEAFTLVFIIAAIAFSVFFATRNDVEVVVPADSYSLGEINFGEKYNVLDTLEGPPVNVSPYDGLLLASGELDAKIHVYYWKAKTVEEAKKIWKDIWLIYGDNLGNKGKIEKSGYTFGYLEQFETTFYFWQKSVWTFFVNIDRYLTDKEKEDFLKNIIPEEFTK